MVIAFYRSDTLVGLAPLYCRHVRRGGFVVARSVQMIGLSWRDPEPLISEYLDVIAAPQDVAAVREACLDVLLEQAEWQELVVGLTEAGSHWRETITGRTDLGRYYLRELDRAVSYQANLANGFGAYLGQLGQSTRRSVWNLRRRLTEYGQVRIELVGAVNEIAPAFNDLNRLHQLRWGRPAFSGMRLTFHTDLARRLYDGGELALSRLYVGTDVVSVLYDVRKAARQYNIKMAFDPALSSRLSLGLLHLGYAMEYAAERGIQLYDFLAGPGQNSDFKCHLGQARRALSSVQMLRGRVLPSLYRWYDAVR